MPNITDPEHRVDYNSSEAPPSYTCSKCGAGGCKLWRLYQVFLNAQQLFCAFCAAEEEGENISGMEDDGRRPSEYGWTDQIGNLIPAVPTGENDTFWGYTSVPTSGVQWWKRLPSIITAKDLRISLNTLVREWRKRCQDSRNQEDSDYDICADELEAILKGSQK